MGLCLSGSCFGNRTETVWVNERAACVRHLASCVRYIVQTESATHLDSRTKHYDHIRMQLAQCIDGLADHDKWTRQEADVTMTLRAIVAELQFRVNACILCAAHSAFANDGDDHLDANHHALCSCALKHARYVDAVTNRMIRQPLASQRLRTGAYTTTSTTAFARSSGSALQE